MSSIAKEIYCIRVAAALLILLMITTLTALTFAITDKAQAADSILVTDTIQPVKRNDTTYSILVKSTSDWVVRDSKHETIKLFTPKDKFEVEQIPTTAKVKTSDIKFKGPSYEYETFPLSRIVVKRPMRKQKYYQ